MFVVFVSGAVAGLALFVVQRFTVIPLIQTAETYEAAQRANSVITHEQEGWEPAEGWERTGYTAIATILMGIGFAAVLLGSLSFSGTTLNAQRGALWGLAAFVCFGVAPAIGLPPQPPGTPVAEIGDRQLWWVGTVLATAAGLWLLAGKKRTWPLRIAGAVCLVLPHLIGVPVASGQNALPAQFVRRFMTSLVSRCVFWLLVGTVGGFGVEPPLRADEGLKPNEPPRQARH